MDRINILFSTTRQWNPGDEFILEGILNLFRELDINFNPIIYNRNPDIRTSLDYINPLRSVNKEFRGKWIIESFLRLNQKDNSFKDTTNPDIIDLVVFAGSPAWYSRNLYPLYEIIETNNIPVFYLGIGAHENFKIKNLPSNIKNTLNDSKIILTRDKISSAKLKDFGALHYPCPALFSIKDELEKTVSEIQKIGLVFMTNNSVINNKVPKKKRDFLVKIFEKIKDDFNTDIICHYIDEIEDAKKTFKNSEIFYSYDHSDYLNKIYPNYDLIISPRVHGVGPAASSGVPGIYLAHDKRKSTVEMFKAFIESDESTDEVINFIDQISQSPSKISKNLLEHKNTYKEKYLKKINKSLNNLNL